MVIDTSALIAILLGEAEITEEIKPEGNYL